MSIDSLRSEKPRTCTENPTIGPVFFAEENFALARIAVKPSRHKPQVLAEIAARCRGLRYELLAKNVLGGARLAGNLGKAEEKRLCQPSAANAKDANGLVFGGALQDHRVEVLNPARKFRLAAQNLIEFFHFFMESGCAFEIELFAGFFALVLYGGAHRASGRFEELHQPLNFDVIFFFCAAREARGEAHFHFRVETAGKCGVTANLDLAAANFE